jgi:triphosphoribosyl-dephospho-CoA synthase
MKPDVMAHEEKIAVLAAAAMSLEAASYPKPGNVHRLKDFKETTFEHFLISSLSAEPVFQKSASASDSKTKDFGPLFYDAILKSQCFQSGGNTHFGTLILLLPLSMAAGIVFKEKEENTDKKTSKRNKNKKSAKQIIEKAAEICKKTTVEDAVCFYKAFELLDIPVQKIETGRNENKEKSKKSNALDLTNSNSADLENSNSTDLTNSKTADLTNLKALDLTNPKAPQNIQFQKASLYDLMKSGAQRDMVAKEWVTDFEKSALFSKKLIENKRFFETRPKFCYGSFINSAVVYTFMEFLAEFEDTFIVTKFNQKKASKIRKRASKIIQKDHGKRNLMKMLPKIRQLDQKMQKEKINPGSLADITAAGIFIALLNGMTI